MTSENSKKIVLSSNCLTRKTRKIRCKQDWLTCINNSFGNLVKIEARIFLSDAVNN